MIPCTFSILLLSVVVLVYAWILHVMITERPIWIPLWFFSLVATGMALGKLFTTFCNGL